MFIVIWKYTVKPENREAFQLEYRKGGVWSRLFQQSDGYTGSYLHHGYDDSNIYIVIDHWKSRELYENFIFNYKETYKKLSDLLSHLYVSEERIGAFNLLD